MDFTHYTTETRKGQHLNFEERMTIELRLKDGWNINQMRRKHRIWTLSTRTAMSWY